MVYKYAYLNTLLLLNSTFMLSVDEDAAKRGGKIVMEIIDHGKSWKIMELCF